MRSCRLIPLLLLLLHGSAFAQDVTTREQRAALRADDDAVQANLAEAAAAIVEQTNAFRVRERREPVTIDDKLTATAQAFAAFMADSSEYGHRADGRAPADRVKAQQYAYCSVSENIAFQFSSRGFQTAELAQALTQGWIDSPGHRANMLAPESVHTGVAVARSRGGVYYAVQLFARPESMSFSFTLGNDGAEPLHYELDGKPYDLPPRSRAKHTLCIPAELKLPDDLKLPPGTTRAFKPVAGADYAVRDTKTGRQLSVKPAR